MSRAYGHWETHLNVREGRRGKEPPLACLGSSEDSPYGEVGERHKDDERLFRFYTGISRMA